MTATTADEGGIGRLTESYHDQAGRLTRTTAKTQNRGVAEDQPTAYAYDLAGRVLTTTYPDNGMVVSAYNAAGERTDRTVSWGASNSASNGRVRTGQYH